MMRNYFAGGVDVVEMPADAAPCPKDGCRGWRGQVNLSNSNTDLGFPLVACPLAPPETVYFINPDATFVHPNPAAGDPMYCPLTAD